jgi:ketosteroid isomerase-like protein
MKLFSSITVLMSVLLISMASLAQQNNETEIRNLEKQEGEAFAKKDMIALLKLFSPNLVVNSPVNKVFGFADVMNMIRNRKIDVGSVEKVIEKITFVENIAIVMGHDIVTPQGAMDNAGKTLTRRYTDIWMKDKNSWRLSARQATIISVF